MENHWPSYCFGAANSLAPFARLVAEDRLPQGILIVGRAGVGKKTYALALASLSFCGTTDGCGHCAACRRIIAGQHPHIFCDHQDPELKSVASIARLQDHLALRVGRSPQSPHARRLAIIADVDQLSLGAANRLLKTLEEPPESSGLILTSSRPQNVLPTIRSRCITLQLRPPRLAEVARYFADREIADLDFLYQRYGGSIGEIIKAVETRDLGQDDGLRSFQAQLQAGQFTAMLEEIDKIKLGKSASASDIAAAGEYALNHRYRALFLGSGEHREANAQGLDPHTIALRRNLLRSIKDLATAQRIALNAPLAAEALFYQGFIGEDHKSS